MRLKTGDGARADKTYGRRTYFHKLPRQNAENRRLHQQLQSQHEENEDESATSLARTRHAATVALSSHNPILFLFDSSRVTEVTAMESQKNSFVTILVARGNDTPPSGTFT